MTSWITGPQMDEVAELQGRSTTLEMTKLRRHDGYIYLNGYYVIELARAAATPRSVTSERNRRSSPTARAIADRRTA